VYFLTIDDPTLADDILSALRKRLPGFPAGRGFGSTPTILRYGKLSASDLDKTERILVARALEDFMEGRRSAGCPPRERWKSDAP